MRNDGCNASHSIKMFCRAPPDSLALATKITQSSDSSVVLTLRYC